MNPHRITEQFEDAVAAYTGAPYAVATTSCTMGIFLCLQWLKSQGKLPDVIDCPKHTYVGVAQSIVHAGSRIRFTDEDWQEHGRYRLAPTPIIDTARWFSTGMYHYMGQVMMVTSHHWGKTLGIQQGGCILTSEPEAVEWLRRARFDGRTPGVPPAKDRFQIGWHAYLSPEIAAEGLMRLALLPRHNDPLPNDDYPDLSRAEVFQPYIARVDESVTNAA